MVVAIYFVKVLIKTMMKVCVTGRAKQATMFQLGFESMPNQVDVMQLKCFGASANVTERVLFQQNTLDFRATCSQMLATGYLLCVPSSLLHSAPPKLSWACEVLRCLSGHRRCTERS